MSAFKWLVFGVGLPVIAVLLAIMYEFVYPAIDLMSEYSTSQESATGIQWYTDFMNFLPLIILLLLAFMLLVGIINRRRQTVR